MRSQQIENQQIKTMEIQFAVIRVWYVYSVHALVQHISQIGICFWYKFGCVRAVFFSLLFRSEYAVYWLMVLFIGNTLLCCIMLWSIYIHTANIHLGWGKIRCKKGHVMNRVAKLMTNIFWASSLLLFPFSPFSFDFIE